MRCCWQVAAPCLGDSAEGLADGTLDVHVAFFSVTRLARRLAMRPVCHPDLPTGRAAVQTAAAEAQHYQEPELLPPPALPLTLLFFLHTHQRLLVAPLPPWGVVVCALLGLSPGPQFWPGTHSTPAPIPVLPSILSRYPSTDRFFPSPLFGPSHTPLSLLLDSLPSPCSPVPCISLSFLSGSLTQRPLLRLSDPLPAAFTFF